MRSGPYGRCREGAGGVSVGRLVVWCRGRISCGPSGPGVTMVARPEQRAGRGPAPTVGWDGTDVWWGCAVSAVAWVVWCRGRISCGPVAAYR